MSNSGTGAGDIFDVKKVRRLVEMMKQHDLAEIDLRQGDQRIRLRRGAEVQLTPGDALSAGCRGPAGSGRRSIAGRRRTADRSPPMPI